MAAGGDVLAARGDTRSRPRARRRWKGEAMTVQDGLDIQVPQPALLSLADDVVLLTRDLVQRAKPDPHPFLAAARRLGVDPAHCFVVGDSIWDLLAALRAGALGIGLLSGGYGREELERSGAYRVYADPAEMLTRLEEVGVRPIR